MNPPAVKLVNITPHIIIPGQKKAASVEGGCFNNKIKNQFIQAIFLQLMFFPIPWPKKLLSFSFHPHDAFSYPLLLFLPFLYRKYR